MYWLVSENFETIKGTFVINMDRRMSKVYLSKI